MAIISAPIVFFEPVPNFYFLQKGGKAVFLIGQEDQGPITKKNRTGDFWYACNVLAIHR